MKTPREIADEIASDHFFAARGVKGSDLQLLIDAIEKALIAHGQVMKREGMMEAVDIIERDCKYDSAISGHPAEEYHAWRSAKEIRREAQEK